MPLAPGWSGRIEIADAALVVDASVFVEYLAPGAAVDQVSPLFSPGWRCELWAPDLCVLEVANALRKRFLSDPRFTRSHLTDAITDLLLLDPVLVGARALVGDALSHVDRLTFYDASYLALAKLRRLPLCTLDSGLAEVAEATGLETLTPGTERYRRWIHDGQNR